ncbi:MAG: cold shock domain-containing protein, partial [Neisseriaceae bacterium]|nr:cold shock domain-containing protein [Neisseriaceae bacterium]
MKGMIKFYNKDKGFGFVVGENNQDYYFNHAVIPFGKMPNSGDMIEFEVSDKPTSNKHKEPTITKMIFTGEQAVGMSNPNDSRIECPHCH